MRQKILDLFSAICSPTEGEQALAEGLCDAARGTLAARLRPGLSPEDCGEAFPIAAAMLAAAGLLPLRSNRNVEQFTVGEVSVRTSSGGTTDAAALRQEAARLMAPYLNADGFAFREVRG